MSTYQDDLIANYDELREQRGWSAAQMAEHLDPLDASLAAAYREAHPGKREAAAARRDDAEGAPAKKIAAPKKRTAPAKPSTTAKK